MTLSTPRSQTKSPVESEVAESKTHEEKGGYSRKRSVGPYNLEEQMNIMMAASMGASPLDSREVVSAEGGAQKQETTSVEPVVMPQSLASSSIEPVGSLQAARGPARSEFSVQLTSNPRAMDTVERGTFARREPKSPVSPLSESQFMPRGSVSSPEPASPTNAPVNIRLSPQKVSRTVRPRPTTALSRSELPLQVHLTPVAARSKLDVAVAYDVKTDRFKQMRANTYRAQARDAEDLSENWESERVADFLAHDLPDAQAAEVRRNVLQQQIRGDALRGLTMDSLKVLGIKSALAKAKLLAKIQHMN
eukprot:gb/GEZN01009381.1/.p1 GENE.gb/GEZN01009381.1/~~gb/GEZN01009381.1/.p1  ORF type:complete len:321 (+),score=30.73 gb/GEZN01009381.1/:46-963(+)